MATKDKWDRNLNNLMVSSKYYFIYVPIQFGNLSNDLRRCECIERAVVREGNNRREYKLLKIVSGKGAGRRMIWSCMRQKEPSGEYEFEFGFERYNPSAWTGIKKMAEIGGRATTLKKREGKVVEI